MSNLPQVVIQLLFLDLLLIVSFVITLWNFKK